MRKIINNQHGFTLIEALTAMVVLTVGILSLYTMQVTSVQSNSTANTLTRAAVDGSNLVEELFASKFDNAALLNDVDGDGTNQDQENNGSRPQGNGVDDDGGNFGLDDFQCCPDGNDAYGNAVAGCTALADYCATAFDNYEIYWNVAVNEPMVNTNRVKIRVIRNDRGQRKGADFEYIVGLDMQGLTK